MISFVIPSDLQWEHLMNGPVHGILKLHLQERTATSHLRSTGLVEEQRQYGNLSSLRQMLLLELDRSSGLLKQLIGTKWPKQPRQKLNLGCRVAEKGFQFASAML